MGRPWRQHYSINYKPPVAESFVTRFYNDIGFPLYSVLSGDDTFSVDKVPRGLQGLDARRAFKFVKEAYALNSRSYGDKTSSSWLRNYFNSLLGFSKMSDEAIED